jgi:hypothetical protein
LCNIKNIFRKWHIIEYIYFILVDWATLAQQWIKMKEGLPVTEKDKDEILVDVPKEDPAVNSISVAAPTWSSTPPLGIVVTYAFKLLYYSV